MPQKTIFDNKKKKKMQIAEFDQTVEKKPKGFGIFDVSMVRS